MIVLCFVTKVLPPVGFLMALPLLEAKDGTVQLIKDCDTLISKYSRFYFTVSPHVQTLKLQTSGDASVGLHVPSHKSDHVWLLSCACSF